MIPAVFSFLLAASIAAALTPVSRWVSIRFGAVDHPDERKVHRNVMPRMGGLAIVAAFVFPVGLFWVIGPLDIEGSRAGAWQIVALLVGGSCIAALGAIDDTRGLRARDKFAVQLVVAIVAWVLGFRFEMLGLPIVGVVKLPVWLDLPLSVLWITGIINAINLIDGLDGLAAGVTFFVAASNFVLAMLSDSTLGAIFSATIGGAVIGFLLFNWNPAIVFMGDTGAMFLGYILAATSMITSQKTSTAVAMVFPIVALGVPVIDTLMSMFRRFLEKRSLFSPDKGHLHHQLLKAGLNQRRAVLTIYAISFVFAVGAIAITAAKDIEAAVAMIVLALMVVGVVRLFGVINVKRSVGDMIGGNKLVERLRPLIPKLSIEILNSASNLDDIWDALVNMCSAAGFTQLSWNTVALKPADERKIDLRQESLESKNAVSASSLFTKISCRIDSPSYLVIKFVYPSNLNKKTTEFEMVMQLIGDSIGAAIGKLKKEGRLQTGKLSPASDAACGESQSGDFAAPIERDHRVGAQSEIREIPAQAHRSVDANEKVWEAVMGEPYARAADASPQGCRHGEILDDLWHRFSELCRQRGFIGAAWNTVGVNPQDERSVRFDGFDGVEGFMLRKSVSISPLAFVQLTFFFSETSSKKVPDFIKRAAKEISSSMAVAFLSLGRVLHG